jgi:hypothetical protein
MGAMDAPTWLGRFGAAAGVAVPTEEETEALLALAGVAAHASERLAAPLTCWLAATAGLSPIAARELARSLVDDGGDR